MELHFIIPGKPVAKQRVRVVSRGASYTPKETREFEQLVGGYAYLAGARSVDDVSMFSVDIIVTQQIPKSWSKARTSAAWNGVYSNHMPDIDNVAKSILDGLNKVVWKDDKQVAIIKAQKLWGKADNTYVTIKEIHDGYVGND